MGLYAEDKREKKILDERRASGVVAPTEKRDATRGDVAPPPGDCDLCYEGAAVRAHRCVLWAQSEYCRGALAAHRRQHTHTIGTLCRMIYRGLCTGPNGGGGEGRGGGGG